MPLQYIPILNLQHKAKIGTALTPEQITAIKTFYVHIENNKKPDEYGIYKEASDLIYALEIDLKNLHAGYPLIPQQRVKLSALYRQIIAIHQDNKIDIVIPGSDQTKITDACEKVLKVLTTSTPEFEQYVKQQNQERQRLTKLNAQEQTDLKQQGISKNKNLELILRRAIQDNRNWTLTAQEIKLIKNALGKEQFEYFLERYNLNAKHYSMDDLRMLIIGTISHVNEQILQSSFFHHLYYSLDINERAPSAQFQLGAKLSKSILNYNLYNEMQKISKKPPTDLLDKIVNWTRSFIPKKWSFIISERFKANSNFANDLDIANLAANVKRWRRELKPNQSEKQVILEQRAASYEYLFHKIAYKNLKDGTIIPIIEENGIIQHYKTYMLINDNGLVGIVLVPASTKQQHLDIKVLFRGTHNIGSAIMDTERYGAGYHSFRENEKEMLIELSKIIGKEKHEAKKNGYTPSISLTIGGHSLGGALAQNFYASLLKCKLLPIYNKYHGNHKVLHKILLPVVTKQVAYELEMNYQGKKYYPQEIKEKLIKERITYLLKSLDKYYDKYIHDEHLVDISDMNFSILNSAGVPFKIRDLAADSLALLQTTQHLSLQFTNLMVGGDVLQQTGQTTVSAGLSPENINVETIKIDSGLEGKAKKQIVVAAAFTAVEFLVKVYFTGLKIPALPWIPTFSDIVHNIKKAHCDLHFDDPDKPVKYVFQSNRDYTAQKQIENLTTKISIVNSVHFQTVKKHLSSWLKTLYSKVSLTVNKLKDGEFFVRKRINEIDELLDIEVETPCATFPEHIPLVSAVMSPHHKKEISPKLGLHYKHKSPASMEKNNPKESPELRPRPPLV